jgi:nucleoside-diphosphate-sugar epimerase
MQDNSLIMVTGASGFVGKHLVRFLMNKGVSVRPCVREASTSHSAAGPLCVVGDINEKTDWSAALNGVSVVVHAAARVHVMNENDPEAELEYYRVNFAATVNLARQALQAGVKRLIFLSTAKVLGESSSKGVPLKAGDTISPCGHYARSKADAEAALMEISARSRLEVVIIRPPLVYGPRVKANFSLLARAVQSGLPLPVGALNQNRRSMVSVQNLNDFIYLCLTAMHAKNQTFMISDGEDVSTAELVSRMGRALDRKICMIPVPIGLLHVLAFFTAKKSSMSRLSGSFQVDISKNLELINWQPKLSLDEGLRLVLSDLNENKR